MGGGPGPKRTGARTPSSNRDEGGREEEGTEHQEVEDRLYVAGLLRFLVPVVQVSGRNMFLHRHTQSCTNCVHTRPLAVTVRRLGRDSKTVAAGRLPRGGFLRHPRTMGMAGRGGLEGAGSPEVCIMAAGGRTSPEPTAGSWAGGVGSTSWCSVPSSSLPPWSQLLEGVQEG